MGCCQCLGACLAMRWIHGLVQFLLFCALVAQLALSIYSTKDRIDDISDCEFPSAPQCPEECEDLDDVFIDDFIRPIQGTIKGNITGQGFEFDFTCGWEDENSILRIAICSVSLLVLILILWAFTKRNIGFCSRSLLILLYLGMASAFVVTIIVDGHDIREARDSDGGMSNPILMVEDPTIDDETVFLLIVLISVTIVLLSFVLAISTFIMDKNKDGKYMLEEDNENPKPTARSHNVPARNTELAAKADATKEKYRSRLGH